MRPRRSIERLPPLLLALLPLLAYAPCWGAGRLVAPGDGTALHFPLRAAVWQAYRAGELPAWNSSIFLGTPLLASYRPGALYPAMPLLALLPDFAAFQALVLGSLALTGPLVYRYARRLGADAAGAYVAGLGFALGPYLVGHLDDTATLAAAPLLPLLLLAAERWCSSGRARDAVLTSLCLALLLLAGSPEAAGAGAALLAGRVLVARLWPGHAPRMSARQAAVVGGGALLLAAPQIIPTLLAAREAGRALTGLANSQQGVLPGLTGLILRYASHTPAPALALAAVPLVARHLAVRVLGAALAISLGLQWGRPLSAAGAPALVFDFTLSVLAGLCLTALWTQRRAARGARLRALLLGACLASAAALSVAAASLGPLPETLAGAVGTLALALILYFANATASGLRARVWLLPLTVAFALQPHGRRAWEGAPDAGALFEGSGTRRTLVRATERRAGEPVLTLAPEWPGADGSDLAYANLARFAGRRSVNGYDPMVPLRTRAALGAMSVGGVLPAGFFLSSPGRLEMLGIRWVQVPAAALHGLGRGGQELALHLPLAAPRVFPFPMTAARSVRMVSSLVDAAAVPQGHLVARAYLRLASGRGEFAFPVRAGVETAEWAWDRPDVRTVVGHRRPPPAESWPVEKEGFSGHHYAADLALPGPYFVDAVRLEPAPESYWLQLMRLALVESSGGRAVPLSWAALYVSDPARLREAAATPAVRLFEVLRTMGPARVARAVRVLPDERSVLEALALPERIGVDPAREALAAAADVAGAELPPAGRASRAEIVRRGANRLELRAEGPGVLVVAEGWDPGWTARLDGRPARLLRVNHAQTGLPLPAGTHRVVLRYRPRGFAAALALAALGALLLAAWSYRDRRHPPGASG